MPTIHLPKIPDGTADGLAMAVEVSADKVTMIPVGCKPAVMPNEVGAWADFKPDMEWWRARHEAAKVLAARFGVPQSLLR